MKKIGFWFLLVTFSGWLSAGEGTIDLWSGREVTLPGEGAWTLFAGHGRVLRSGTGDARFTIPALPAGATLEACLTRVEKNWDICFHSPAPLAGFPAESVELPAEKEALLHRYGVAQDGEEKSGIRFSGVFPAEMQNTRMVLVFPEQRDFPLSFGSGWTEILLRHAKEPGKLGVLSSRGEQRLDLDGTFSYAVLRREKQKVVVFSPDFDLGKIENILLIRSLLAGED